MDPRAIKILFNTYWASGCWRSGNEQATDPEDLAYAIRAGVMFDPVVTSHHDLVRRATELQDRIAIASVSNAFVSSLSSRRLELRSALGSYALLRHLPPPESTPHVNTMIRCGVCGSYMRGSQALDLNVFSFERLKWGGVRHDYPEYAVFDCQQFTAVTYQPPVEADIAILRSILHTIETAPPNTTSAVLQKYLSPLFPSNKPERDNLVGMLGMCGILETAAHSGYYRKYLNFRDRILPTRNFIDMAYPACWWTGHDGINHEAVEFWFGHILNCKKLS